MKAFSIMAFAAATLTAGAAFGASPVVGTWATVAQTPQGSVEAKLIIAEADDGHEVTFEEAAMPGMGESTVSDIEIGESEFSFTRTLSTPQGPIALNYAGTVEGDAMTANVATDFGDFPFTGTRE